MRKILPLLLAFVMLLGSVTALISCKNDKPEGSATPTTSASDSGSGSPTPTPSGSGSQQETDEDVFKKLGIKPVNYNEQTVYMFHWIAQENEYEIKESETDGNPIDDAIYKKNLYTEQLLNVDLDFFATAGHGGAQQEFADALGRRIEDPMTPVDIVSAYGRTMGVVATRGFLTDLYEYDDLDLTKDWWPRDMQNEFKIKDRLYFISGDISTNLLHMMYAVYYNRDLADKYNIDDLVAKVKDKTWVLDDLIGYTKGTFEEKDGETGATKGDFYGMTFPYFYMDALIQGSNFHLAEPSDADDQAIRITDEFYSETFSNFIDKMIAWVHSGDICNETDYSGIANFIFENGNAIFHIDSTAYGMKLKTTDINFGILPSPMLNEEQGRYYTSIANPFSAYGVCRKSQDGDRAAVVMQTLGYYGKRLTTPAIFEVTYQGKLSVTGEYMEMYEYLRDAISFDIGRIYHNQLNALADIPTYNAITKGVSWAVAMGAFQKGTLNNKLRALNKTLLSLEQ